MADDCARFGAKARKRCGPAGDCAQKLKKFLQTNKKVPISGTKFLQCYLYGRNINFSSA